MPKATATVAEISPLNNIPAGDLADQNGRLGAEIAALEARRKAVAAELVRRGADVEGMMFRSTIVAETSVTTLDRAAIERDMGETWIAKYLKWSRHCASVRTAPLAAVVAKMAA